MQRSWPVLLLLGLAGCGLFDGIVPEVTVLSSDELDAIAAMFAASMGDVAAGVGESSAKPAAGTAPWLTPLQGGPSRCAPDDLVPPQNCGAGGNMYFTLNASCEFPSGCCGNDPPCDSDQFTMTGAGKQYFNFCREMSTAGRAVEIWGSLNSTFETVVESSCAGIATGYAKVTVDGVPSVRVDGKEVCHGTVFVTMVVVIGATVQVTVSGSVCGQPIYARVDQGCLTQCNGYCCPMGAVCGTCSAGTPCFGAAYTVDCCNGNACPTGTTCTQDNQCSF